MLRRVICFLLLLLLIMTSPFCSADTSASQATQVNMVSQLTQFRWATHTDAVTGTTNLRLVFDLTGPVKADGAVFNSPSSCLVINVQGAVPDKMIGSVNFDGKIVNRVNIVSVDGQNSKINIELPFMISNSDYKMFTLPADAGSNKPFRLVVDINKPISPNVFSYTSGLKGKVITIDPGHGGSDTGAIGPDNIQEKTITLAVAMKVKSLLEQAGAKVVMTRTDDCDVFAPNDTAVEELGARAAVGNQNKSDVFVDIHANYFGNPQVSGTGTYYYSKSVYDKLLAQNIQSSAVNSSSLNDRGIYLANFYVLKHTLMPAILIELGFLSNPAEEKMLNTPQLQQKLAQGIVSGLDNFFIQAAKLGSER